MSSIIRLARYIVLSLAILCTSPFQSAHAQAAYPEEEQAIRALLGRFYEGWNAHDVDKMISTYADDIDHINVFAEWHQGKDAIARDLRLLHAGQKVRPDGSIAPAGQKAFTIEKVRFITGEVAVAHVRSLSSVGNLGAYVLAKRDGEWRVVSFTNVHYELQ